MNEYRGTLHQPPNPAPDCTVPPHNRLHPFRECCWWEPGGWRVGRVGDANVQRCEVWPTDRPDHVRVFVNGELDELRVRPLPPKKPRHEV